MSHAAFLHHSLNAEGDWNARTSVLVAILAYLNEATEQTASETQLKRLKEILAEQPVSSSDLKDWFDRNFRLS